MHNLRLSCRQNTLKAYFDTNYFDQSQCLYPFKIYLVNNFSFSRLPSGNNQSGESLKGGGRPYCRDEMLCGQQTKVH